MQVKSGLHLLSFLIEAWPVDDTSCADWIKLEHGRVRAVVYRDCIVGRVLWSLDRLKQL